MFRRTDKKVEALRANQALATLSDDDLEQLASLADVTDLPAGRVLVEERRPGHEVFLLLEGVARVVKDGEEIATLGAGQFVGEMALLDDHPRSATVETTGPARLLVFDARAFDQMVSSNRALTRRLLQQVSTRLRAVEDAAAG